MKATSAALMLAMGFNSLLAEQCPNIHHLCYRREVNPRDGEFKCWTREAYGWSCDAYSGNTCESDAIDVAACNYDGKLGAPAEWESCMQGGSLVYPTESRAPECWRYESSWHCKRADKGACQQGYVDIRSFYSRA